MVFPCYDYSIHCYAMLVITYIEILLLSLYETFIGILTYYNDLIRRYSFQCAYSSQCYGLLSQTLTS